MQAEGLLIMHHGLQMHPFGIDDEVMDARRCLQHRPGGSGLSRQRRAVSTDILAAGILLAWVVMILRVFVEVFIVHRPLLPRVALPLGLIDGLGEARATIRERFGKDARLVVANPRRSLLRRRRTPPAVCSSLRRDSFKSAVASRASTEIRRVFSATRISATACSSPMCGTRGNHPTRGRLD